MMRWISLLLALAVLAGCGNNDAEGADKGSDTATTEVIVFAAASLTEAFTEVGEAFEAIHPDSSVIFNFAGSSDLVAQINEGAPADVYASANVANMDKLVDADGAADEPEIFAANAATIIVEHGNPTEIETLEDLSNPDLTVVTCAPEVPCGAYATEIFENADVTVTPDSLEKNVKAVVTKVTLGEADAGIAYLTDVAAANGKIDSIPIPNDVNVRAEYPIAVTKQATNPTGAAEFIDFVTGPDGQRILSTFGFNSP